MNSTDAAAAGAINPVAIFLPILAVVALTIVAFVWMSVTRARAAQKGGRDRNYYRAFIGEPEPEYAIVGVRHYGNMFEVPVFFYTACLSLFALNTVGVWGLVFAWAYVVARVIQSVVHLTYNNPAHRGAPFVLGWLFIIGLWGDVALHVVARL